MRAIAIGLVTLLVVSSGRSAHASGGGQSSSGSSNSSDSSKGSGDSSNSSNDSSKSSNDSSKSSNNSTQNSPKNSSDYTTKHSSDWTTHDHDAHVMSIALVVVSVGATVVGVVLKDRSQRRPPTAALAGFMRRQHALLLHDVSTAEGPVLDAWAHDLRLTPAEKRRLRRELEGSEEQAELIGALDGPIEEKHAERFGAAFLRVTARALGRARTNALVTQAMSAARDS